MMEPEQNPPEQPWYLAERPLALAKAYLLREDIFQVEDVSPLSVGVDLLVSPHDNDWTCGVVTRGVMRLPDDAIKQVDARTAHNVIGISVFPSEELALPLPATLPPIPVFYFLFEMETDEGYYGVFNADHLIEKANRAGISNASLRKLTQKLGVFPLDGYQNKERIGLGLLSRLPLSELSWVARLMLPPDTDDAKRSSDEPSRSYEAAISALTSHPTESSS